MLLCLFGIQGCGDDELGPETAEVESFVFDDPASGASTFGGTASGDAQVLVSPDEETWTELGSLNGITVALQSSGEVSIHGAQKLATGTYKFARITLSSIEIKIDAGSTVDGETFSKEMTTNLAATTPLTIDKSIPDLTVSEGQKLNVRFDLNVGSWLSASDVQNGVVASSGIASAVSVEAEVK